MRRKKNQQNLLYYSSSLVKECRGRNIDLVLTKYISSCFIFGPAGTCIIADKKYLTYPSEKLPKMNAAGTKSCVCVKKPMTQRSFWTGLAINRHDSLEICTSGGAVCCSGCNLPSLGSSERCQDFGSLEAAEAGLVVDR